MRIALLRNLLFPPVCVACGALLALPDYGKEAPALCPDCDKQWRAESAEICGICLRPVGECACVTEEMHRAQISALYQLAYYRNGVRNAVPNRMVYRIKEAPDRRTIRFFAGQLSQTVDKLLRETGWTHDRCLLVWLPRGRENRLRTGTDQAKSLADAISAKTGIPVCGLIQRQPHADKEQKALTPLQRKQNARSAFRLSRHGSIADGVHIFLIDDIVTTGSSMAAAARLLRPLKPADITALAVLSDEVNRTANEKQPVIDRKSTQ